jgi:hypothetical protein
MVPRTHLMTFIIQVSSANKAVRERKVCFVCVHENTNTKYEPTTITQSHE